MVVVMKWRMCTLMISFWSCFIQKAVVLWMCDPAERDARIVYDALKGLSKDTAAITEVLYPRTSSQIVEIIQAYNSMFGRSLEEDIALKTSGDTKKVTFRQKLIHHFALLSTTYKVFLQISEVLRNFFHHSDSVRVSTSRQIRCLRT